MAKYRFNLIETYSKEVEIEAKSEDEAFEILDDKVAEGVITALDCNSSDKTSYEYEIYRL